MTLPAAKTAEEEAAKEDMLLYFFYQYSLSVMKRGEMLMNANVVGVGVVLFGLVGERARAASCFFYVAVSPLFQRDRLICCCLFNVWGFSLFTPERNRMRRVREAFS
jgi:hypothetical protein